jgi:hypothetical protein
MARAGNGKGRSRFPAGVTNKGNDKRMGGDAEGGGGWMPRRVGWGYFWVEKVKTVSECMVSPGLSRVVGKAGWLGESG